MRETTELILHNQAESMDRTLHAGTAAEIEQKILHTRLMRVRLPIPSPPTA